MPEEWDEPLPGMNVPTKPRRPPEPGWGDRVQGAIAELDRHVSMQKGSSMIFVPAASLLTVEVAAAIAVDRGLLNDDEEES